MRRKRQEIKDKETIRDVIEKAKVLRLGMSLDNRPYVVPLCFGYDGEHIYFHCAKKGLKVDHLKKNPAVCFELESKAELIEHGTEACKFDFSYRSVIGFGEASEVRGIDQKRAALKVIMSKYSRKKWDFPMPMLLAVGVWKIKIDSLTGKQSEDNIR